MAAVVAWLDLQSLELIKGGWQPIGRTAFSLALRKPLCHPALTVLLYPPRALRYAVREMFTSNGFGQMGSASVNASSPQGMQYQADVHFLMWREFHRMKPNQTAVHERERGPGLIWQTVNEEALGQEMGKPLRASIFKIEARAAVERIEIAITAQGREARSWMRRLEAYLARTSDAELRIAAEAARI